MPDRKIHQAASIRTAPGLIDIKPQGVKAWKTLVESAPHCHHRTIRIHGEARAAAVISPHDVERFKRRKGRLPGFERSKISIGNQAGRVRGGRVQAPRRQHPAPS